MILIDSSVWIHFFNGTDTETVRVMEKVIAEEEDACISDYILTEVLQGFKRDKDFLTARRHLMRFPVYSLKTPDAYIEAAQIYRLCRKKGITIRKTADCLIAQTAIEHDLYLLHEDGDFDRIASVCPLKIYKT
jgi:predicted nucleic acid-binding protein